jgi:hypothetical protein
MIPDEETPVRKRLMTTQNSPMRNEVMSAGELMRAPRPSLYCPQRPTDLRKGRNVTNGPATRAYSLLELGRSKSSVSSVPVGVCACLAYRWASCLEKPHSSATSELLRPSSRHRPTRFVRRR